MDLKAKLAEAKLADYFERLTQASDGSFNALWDAMQQHPTAELVIRGTQEINGIVVYDPLNSRVYIAGEEMPKSSVVFITPNAILQLVKEAKSIYAMSSELLRWMKEKKLDQ